MTLDTFIEANVGENMVTPNPQCLDQGRATFDCSSRPGHTEDHTPLHTIQ